MDRQDRRGRSRERADMARRLRADGPARLRKCSSVRSQATCRRLGVVDLGPGVVEEGVVDVLVDDDLDVLAERLQLVLEACAISGEK